MQFKWVTLGGLALVASTLMVTTALQAQVRSNDPTITMMDNCSTEDPAYEALGGCPEGAPFPGWQSYKGDVPLAELFRLLFSPLAQPGHVIGHPSWRNEPSYISVPEGQTVRVVNRGGRAHSFTEVANFGGGFVPPLNGTMAPAPECANPAAVELLPHGGTQTLPALAPGTHTFQCCIHPWMRGAIRVN